jgi:shikimate dehydrogenase
MMQAAFAAVGLSGWRYQLLPVPPELFDETTVALPQAGFCGANVTIPHKQAALGLADEASETARAIGAANTLVFNAAGEIAADNTDGPALLEVLRIPPGGRTALVLGAGGSARAAVWALRAGGAAEVHVWNRQPDRARRLCEELGCQVAFDVRAADVLINCTPLGGDGGADAFKQLPIEADGLAMFGCVVDFAYGNVDTSLVRAARTLGVPVVDGLDLLVEQGALSCERFTRLPAPREAMRAAARGPRPFRPRRQGSGS